MKRNLVKLLTGTILHTRDLNDGDIVQCRRVDYIFLADDRGPLFGVADGDKIIPFTDYKEAEKYSKVRKYTKLK